MRLPESRVGYEIADFLRRVGSNMGYPRKLSIQNCNYRPFSESFGLHVKSDLQKSDNKDRNFGYPTRLSGIRTPLVIIDYDLDFQILLIF